MLQGGVVAGEVSYAPVVLEVEIRDPDKTEWTMSIGFQS